MSSDLVPLDALGLDHIANFLVEKSYVVIPWIQNLQVVAIQCVELEINIVFILFFHCPSFECLLKDKLPQASFAKIKCISI